MVAVIGALLPAVAQAHGPLNPAASSYLALVKATPAGVQVHVVDGDLRLWMHVTGPRQVTVLDYQGSPYVRFTSAGVEVNHNSAMYYLNQTPSEIPPTTLSATTRPHWYKATSGDSYEWHDGRLHALATTLATPGARDLGAWTIPLRINGHRAQITGILDRAPAPSAGWWWPIAVVLLGLPAILRLGNRQLDRQIARILGWTALPAFVIASVAAGLHGRPGLAPSRLIELGVELAFAAWAALNLRRRHRELTLFFLIGFAALFRGVGAITVLWRGYVLLALPATICRIAVVTCLATAVGLLAIVWPLTVPERNEPTAGNRPATDYRPPSPPKQAPVA